MLVPWPYQALMSFVVVRSSCLRGVLVNAIGKVSCLAYRVSWRPRAHQSAPLFPTLSPDSRPVSRVETCFTPTMYCSCSQSIAPRYILLDCNAARFWLGNFAFLFGKNARESCIRHALDYLNFNTKLPRFMWRGELHEDSCNMAVAR